MLGAVLDDATSKLTRCLGTKQLWKSKVAKHHMLGAVLDVATLKIGTPLKREAHLEVKSVKAHHIRTTFGRYDGYADRQTDIKTDR